MSNIIDFCKYKKEQSIKIESTSPEVRVVVFLEYLRTILELLYKSSQTYPGSTFCHDFRCVTHGRKKTQSQQLFVQLPEMCEYSLIVHGFLPFSKETDPTIPSNLSLVEQQYNFSQLILDCLQSKQLLDILNVYTIVPAVELKPGQVVINTRCINVSNIITTVVDFEPDSLGIRYKIQNKLFVTVEQNTTDPIKQLNNMDHLFAMDLLNYCSNILIEHCGSSLI